MDNDNLNGALTGMALSAATFWARYDDDTQRRLRNNRLDLQAMENLIREMNARGEVLRAKLPVVQDAQVGLALANPAATSPQLIPTNNPLSRPDFVSRAQAAITQMGWPPQPGVYDERGMVKEVGEMTQTFLALTYEEVRCFIEALPQSQQPSAECKRAIFFAANSLTRALCEMDTLTYDQFLAAWHRLFSGVALAGPHSDSAKAPKVIGTLGTNVASVVPAPSSYNNPQTDRASRWRVTASAANPISAGTAICTIQFGSEWRWQGGALQPAVSLNSLNNIIFADPLAITSTQVMIYNSQQINAGVSVDFHLMASSGLGD